MAKTEKGHGNGISEFASTRPGAESDQKTWKVVRLIHSIPA